MHSYITDLILIAISLLRSMSAMLTFVNKRFSVLLPNYMRHQLDNGLIQSTYIAKDIQVHMFIFEELLIFTCAKYKFS